MNKIPDIFALDWKPINGIVLYGAGWWGNELSSRFERSGIEICAIVDNNTDKHGSSINGIIIMSFDEAIANFPNALFIFSYDYEDFETALGSAIVLHQPKGRVNFCGVHDLPHIRIFTDTYPKYLVQYYDIDQGDVLVNLIEFQNEAKKASAVFREPASVLTYNYIYKRRLENSFVRVPRFPKSTTNYYEPVLWSPIPNEHIIDCGAYTGDTLSEIVSNGIIFERYVAFEPDRDSYTKLIGTIASLPKEIQSKCDALPYGVGEKCEFVAFSSGLGDASYFSSDADNHVEVVSLDDLQITPSITPTFIKMDIEGFELAALKGTINAIRKYRPVLAVCLYHKPQDFFEIPLYLAEKLTNYEFFLRTYRYRADWVLYVVPKERTNYIS